jgi:hypothetical protein
MSAPSRLWIAALALWLACPAAEATEIRQVTFPDGRTFVGEIVATTATSLTLRIPSGDMDVPYDANPEISPAGEADVAAQPPLAIVVLETKSPGDLSGRAAEINDFLITRLADIPHTRVTSAQSLPPETHEMLAGCGQSLGCMLRALEGALLVHGVVSFVEHHEDGQRLRLISLGIPDQIERSRAELVLFGDVDAFSNRLLRQGYQLLGLRPSEPIPDDAPVVLATAGGEKVDDGDDGDGDGGGDAPDGADLIGHPPDGPAEESVENHGTEAAGSEVGTASFLPTDLRKQRRVAIALGFVPFPGLGSAHLRDPSGFALSLLFDVGAGAGLVYLFGATSPTALGFHLPAILSSYGVGVLINQIAAAVSFRRYRTRTTGRSSAHDGRPALTFRPLLFAVPEATGQPPRVHVGLSISGW